MLVNVCKALLEEGEKWDDTVALAVDYGMLGVVTLVTLIFNTIIQMVTIRYVMSEGQDTQSQEQSSIFDKLSVGLTVNTVIVPLVVALVLTNGNIGDQTWSA